MTNIIRFRDHTDGKRYVMAPWPVHISILPEVLKATAKWEDAATATKHNRRGHSARFDAANGHAIYKIVSAVRAHQNDKRLICKLVESSYYPVELT